MSNLGTIRMINVGGEEAGQDQGFDATMTTKTKAARSSPGPGSQSHEQRAEALEYRLSSLLDTVSHTCILGLYKRV